MSAATHQGLDFCDFGIGGVYLPEGAGVALPGTTLPWGGVLRPERAICQRAICQTRLVMAVQPRRKQPVGS
ncbi:MAG: hypothetical protein M3378_06860 [Actinomycetota bacterium]|nr:hypothetical protein [Actinomycetota bacterium]